ncbi:VTT domain-containing protein [Psychrobacillus sp.]|uniref:TVP38/TMEM64 family protein n=1 Tax=Psychrobacillus sp. TaxID=1871623 RepID=UPI0028BF2DAB|nr:VTT domain-containing protein [Psychrobacillus sp.]
MKKVMSKLTKKQLLIVGGLLFLALFIGLNKDVFSLLLDHDVDAIHQFLNKNIWYAIMFMFTIMLIQHSFTVIPLLLVITINVTLFGFINGVLLSWITSVISSVIVFYAVRYIFQNMIIGKFNSKLIAKVDANAFAYVFQVRLFPLVPTSLINILAGLSTVRLFPFLLATALGNFLYFFILALIPAGILSSEFDEYVLLLIIFVTVLLYYVYKRAKNKKLAR